MSPIIKGKFSKHFDGPSPNNLLERGISKITGSTTDVSVFSLDQSNVTPPHAPPSSRLATLIVKNSAHGLIGTFKWTISLWYHWDKNSRKFTIHTDLTNHEGAADRFGIGISYIRWVRVEKEDAILQIAASFNILNAAKFGNASLKLVWDEKVYYGEHATSVSQKVDNSYLQVVGENLPEGTFAYAFSEGA